MRRRTKSVAETEVNQRAKHQDFAERDGVKCSCFHVPRMRAGRLRGMPRVFIAGDQHA